MTVSTAYAPDVYEGNGSTYQFPTTFPLHSLDHLVVERTTSDGNVTPLAINVDFTATWGGVGQTATIRMAGDVPPESDETLTLSRVVPLTQETNLRNHGKITAETVERALDKLTHIAQQQEDAHGEHDVRITDLEEQTVPGGASEYVFRVSAYGAVGDRVTDDTAAVQAAIEAAPAGSTIKFNGEKHYYLRSLGTITKPLTIDGSGCRITCDITPSGVAGAPLFCFAGSAGAAKAIGAFTRGNGTVTLTTPADASLFDIGDYVIVECADPVNKWDESGQCYVGNSQMVRITNADAGTGVLTLSEPLYNSGSTSPTVSKATVVDGVTVRNFSAIYEVSPGAPFSGSLSELSGTTAPNIVDASYAANVTVENVAVDGFNLTAFACMYVYGATFINCRADNAFYRDTGGTGNAHKCWRSSHVHVYHSLISGVRHGVDWTQCYRCRSSYCAVHAPREGSPLPAFYTHGQGSYEIESFSDSASYGSGWEVGNITFRADYDVKIENFSFFSDYDPSIGVGIRCKSERVSIINPCITTVSTAIAGYQGATDIEISGGIIYANLSNVAVNYAIKFPTNDSLPAVDVKIADITLITGDAGYGIQSENTGKMELTGCRIRAARCYDSHNSYAPTEVKISGCSFEPATGAANAVRIAVGGAAGPSVGLMVTDNVFDGAASDCHCKIRCETNAIIQRNRFVGTGTEVTFIGTDALTVAKGGGTVRDNGVSAIDYDLINGTRYVNGAAGTTRTIAIMTAGVNRWAIRANGTPESGSDAGSDFEISARDDATGAQIDIPLSIARAANGNVAIARPTLLVGASALATAVQHILKAAAGQVKQFVLATGITNRWIFRSNATAEGGSNAGSDLEIIACDDAGAQIDTPVSVVRAANGAISLARPTLNIGASAYAGAVQYVLKSAAGQHRAITFQSGTSNRWVFRANNSAESGSNAGSNLDLVAYDDAGVVIDTPLSINRVAGGSITLARGLITSSARIVKSAAVASSAGTTVIGSTDFFFTVTGSTTHTLTLPSAANGREIRIKNRSTGTVTVNRAGSDTIDGGTTFNLTAGQGTILVANGTDWCRVANA